MNEPIYFRIFYIYAHILICVFIFSVYLRYYFAFVFNVHGSMDGGIPLYLISPCIVDFLPFMMIHISTKYLTMKRSSDKTSSSSQRVHALRHLRSGAFNQSTGKTSKSMQGTNSADFSIC